MPLSLEEADRLLEGGSSRPSQKQPTQTRQGGRSLEEAELLLRGNKPEEASWADVFSDIPAQAITTLKQTETGFRLDMVQRKLKDDPTNPELKREWDSLIEEAKRELAQAREATTEGATWLQRGVQSGITSLPTSLASLAVGLGTGTGAVGALTTMYATTSWQKYAELLAQGQDKSAAEKHAMFQGAVESVTEMFPTLKLLNKNPFFKKMIGTMLTDVPGEVAATYFQGASDVIAEAQRNGQEVTPDMALRALWEQNKEIPTTIVASLVGSGIQSTMMSGVNRLTGRVLEETEPGSKTKDKRKARTAFDELAAKHPNKAKEVADRVARADPALGKELAGRINKWIDASEEDLKKAGESQVTGKPVLDSKKYEAMLKEVDKKLQAKDMSPEEKKVVADIFANAKKKPTPLDAVEKALTELKQEPPKTAAVEEESAVPLPWEMGQPLPYKGAKGEGPFTPQKTDEWSTPQGVFDRLKAAFGFTLDAAATQENAKTPKFFTKVQDGLKQSWAGEKVWLNPPYSNIGPWMEKAYNEAKNNGAVVVALVPANRTDTKWWQDYASKGRVEFIRGRLSFGENKGRAKFPSALVIFGEQNMIPPQAEPVGARGRAEDMASADLTLRRVQHAKSNLHQQRVNSSLYSDQSIVTPTGETILSGKAGPALRMAGTDIEVAGMVKELENVTDAGMEMPGGLGAYLKRLASVVNDDNLGKLLNKLSSRVMDAKLIMVPMGHPSLEGFAGLTNSRGAYNEPNTVRIGVSENLRDNIQSRINMVMIMLHEAVHAAVLDFTYANPKHPLVKELRGMMAEAKRRVRKMNKEEVGTTYHNVYNKLYGMVDLDEFIAETTSNDQMKRLLIMSEKYASGQWKAKRLMGEFARTVRKILGVTDVLQARLLDDVLGATDELMLEAAKDRSVVTGVPVKGAVNSREEITSQPGVDARRLAKITGPQLYDMENMSMVTLKELYQNAVDAIKPLIENGTMKNGTVKVDVDPNTRSITVTDNGLGMSSDRLATTFLKIAGTHKETKRSTGGFGIAKMLFLYGNENLVVTTAKDGKVSTMRTKGSELIEALEDKSFAPKIQIRPFKNSDYAEFPEGHGTSVTVAIPESYTDTQTGREKMIPFDTVSKDWGPSVKPLGRSPIFAPISVVYNGRSLSDVGTNFKPENYTPFVNVKFSWGTARLYVSKAEDPYIYENFHILANGLWQFSKTLGKEPLKSFSSPIPYQFYLDVSPSVAADEPGYPFALNRQGFNPTAQKELDKILRYVHALYAYRSLQSDAESFGEIRYLRAGKLTDSHELKPDVPAKSTSFDLIKQGDKVEVKEGVLLINGKEQQEHSIEDLMKNVPSSDELMVDTKKLKTKVPMIHDNVLIGELNDKPLLDHMMEKFGPRFEKFLDYTAVQFDILRGWVAGIMNYPELLNEVYGLSFDIEYRGVSIRIPFKGTFINPLVPESLDPVERGYGMIGTMIHEFAHFMVRGHDASFPQEMQRIIYKLDSATRSKQFNFDKFRHDFVAGLQQFNDILDEGRRLYDENGNASLKARGKRFRDDASRFQSTEGVAGTAEGFDAGGELNRSGEPVLGGTEEGGAKAGARSPGAGGPAITPLGDQLAVTGYEIDDAAESTKLRPTPDDPVVYTQNGMRVTRADIRAMFALGRKAANKIPGVAIAEGKLREWYRRFASTYVPEGLGADAKLAGALVAKAIATRKWKTAMETTGSRKRRGFWLQNADRMMEFIKGYEAGTQFADESFNEAAAGYRAWMSDIAEADQAKGIKYTPRDNYITHMFEDEDAVQTYFLRKYGRGWGDPYFMKDRSFEAYEDAIKQGFKPRYTNPEDIMMVRAEASNLAHMQVDILNDFAEYGIAIPIKVGRKGALLTKRPDGYAKEPRRSPNGTKYWVHQDADVILKNAFDTQSMYTRKDIWGSLYRGGMNVKNTYVPIQLWGLFHAVHVGLLINNAASLTRAFKSVLAGKLDKNTGKELLSAFNPAGGWWDKGAHRILKAYWGQVSYDQLSDGDKMLMQFMNEGGMVPAMAEQDRISAHQKFFDALKSKEYSMLTPFHAFATILRGMQYPMFHIWIPQMKIASYARDVATALRLDPTLMDDPKRRTLMFRQLAKSIDNRFGEMSYDTLFWNKTIKDIFVLNTLSLGWQIGFIREYAQGTTIDVIRQVTSEKSTAEMAKSGMLDRSMFASFYIATAMMTGAMIQYLFTGEPPEEFQDYLLPKTGEKNADGTDKRLNTPFYTREIASMQKHVQNEGIVMGLTHLVRNKASGVIGLTMATVTGVDSLGREVRDPNSPVLQQTAQTLQYLFKEAWPISFEAMQEAEHEGIALKVLGFGGFTPAAKYLTETPMEGGVKGKFLKYYGTKRTPYERAQMSEPRKELRDAFERNDMAHYDEILAEIEKKFELTPNELSDLEDSVQSGEKPYYKMFARLPWRMQKDLLERHWYSMSEEERQEYLDHSNVEHVRYDFEPPKEKK